MSETLVTSGGANATISVADATPGTAVTQLPADSQTSAAGSGTPLGSDSGSQSDDAGGPQGSADDGRSDSGRGRRWSPIDEIRELRASRRQERQARESVQAELAQLRQQFDELRQLQQPGQKRTARTPADFWQDPAGYQERILDERFERLQESLMDRIAMTREMEAQQVALLQEQGSAVEFIRSQPNYSREDDEDLIDIIESIPNRENINPQIIAEYAWMKLNQERGVGNKSVAKARASGVVGQPPGPGLSGKIWTKAEFDDACTKLEEQGARADQKLLDELTAAAKEGRVR